MSLFDFLKRKKQVEKAKKATKEVEKVSVEKKEKIVKEEKKTTDSAPRAVAGKTGFSYEVIKNPHISEKATYLSEKDQYVFKVSPNYNKKEIKNAVEGIYGVDVVSVNIIKIPSKKRRLGKTQGFRKSYSKAVVKIKSGQKIEIL